MVDLHPESRVSGSQEAPPAPLMLELLVYIASPITVQLQCVVRQGKLLSKSYSFSSLSLYPFSSSPSASQHQHLANLHLPLRPPRSPPAAAARYPSHSADSPHLRALAQGSPLTWEAPLAFAVARASCLVFWSPYMLDCDSPCPSLTAHTHFRV